MGRLKEDNEKTWTTQTDRTIYQWSEPSKTKKGILITKTSVWTHTVRNRMRQKVGEIQVFRSFERGVEDETLSCGTGVTAAALVYAAHYHKREEVHVVTRGGELSVSFDKTSNNNFTNIFLKGPAIRVFSGAILIL